VLTGGAFCGQMFTITIFLLVGGDVMKRIGILVGLLVFCFAAAVGQDDVFTPMKGSATPEFESLDNGVRCLVFGTHIVKTTQTDEGGEDIRMWHREGTAKGIAACSLRRKPYADIKNSDNNSFFGISARYSFIDMGTSAGNRTLSVIETDTGNEVTSVSYFSDSEPRIEAARYLYYDSLTNKKGAISTCKDAAKWKRDGGSVGWVQGKKMDLDEQTTENVGGLRCVYVE